MALDRRSTETWRFYASVLYRGWPLLALIGLVGIWKTFHEMAWQIVLCVVAGFLAVIAIRSWRPLQ